jgi:hypothetical protein
MVELMTACRRFTAAKGVTQNLRSAASGFTKHQQEWIGSLLQRLMKELKVSMGVRNAKVIKAKVGGHLSAHTSAQ